jgi:hypothetical protein
VPGRRETLYLKGEAIMLVQWFPLIASAMAVLCFFAVAAEESSE